MSRYAALIAISLIWGFYYLGVDLSLESGWSGQFMNAIRFLLGALFFLPILYFTGQIKETISLQKRKPLQIVTTALVGVMLGIGLLTLGQESIDSSVAGVLGTTTPLFVALLGLIAFFHQDKIRPIAWLGIALGLLGVLMIYAPWSDREMSLSGIILVLGGAFFIAVEARLILKWFQKENVLGATFLVIFWAGVAFSIFALIEGEFKAGDWLPVISLALFSNAVAHSIYFFLIKKSGPAFANIYAYIIPVIALLAGVFLNNESVTALIVLGALLCLLGAVLVGRGSSID